MPTHQLFAEPIYISKLHRELTPPELKTIHKFKTYDDMPTNKMTINNYVLNKNSLHSLKKDLYKKVTEYFEQIVCTSSSITPYITQSWINYTATNKFHPPHAHQNSFISGIFYIDALKNVDRITFYKDTYRPLVLEIADPNIFNCQTWQLPVETGDVVLFPSHVVHGVEVKKGTNLRTSLSFNVFFKGTIGNNKNLTELTI